VLHLPSSQGPQPLPAAHSRISSLQISQAACRVQPAAARPTKPGLRTQPRRDNSWQELHSRMGEPPATGSLAAARPRRSPAAGQIPPSRPAGGTARPHPLAGRQPASRHRLRRQSRQRTPSSSARQQQLAGGGRRRPGSVLPLRRRGGGGSHHWPSGVGRAAAAAARYAAGTAAGSGAAAAIAVGGKAAVTLVAGAAAGSVTAAAAGSAAAATAAMDAKVAGTFSAAAAAAAAVDDSAAARAGVAAAVGNPAPAGNEAAADRLGCPKHPPTRSKHPRNLCRIGIGLLASPRATPFPHQRQRQPLQERSGMERSQQMQQRLVQTALAALPSAWQPAPARLPQILCRQAAAAPTDSRRLRRPQRRGASQSPAARPLPRRARAPARRSRTCSRCGGRHRKRRRSRGNTWGRPSCSSWACRRR